MDKIIFLGYEILSAFIPFLVIYVILRSIRKKKGVSFSHYHFLMIFVFAIYIICVYHFTGAGTIYDGLIYKLELKQDQINVIPFSQDIDIKAYLLNILLFVPLGLLTPIIWGKMNKLTNVISIGFFFTVLIEISQMLNNRRTDIDDVLLNVLGVVVGFGLFKVWDRFTKSKFNVNSPVILELPIYIIVVLIGRFLLYNEMGLAKILYGF